LNQVPHDIFGRRRSTDISQTDKEQLVGHDVKVEMSFLERINWAELKQCPVYGAIELGAIA
jgi:hypothetical protein